MFSSDVGLSGKGGKSQTCASLTIFCFRGVDKVYDGQRTFEEAEGDQLEHELCQDPVKVLENAGPNDCTAFVESPVLHDQHVAGLRNQSKHFARDHEQQLVHEADHHIFLPHLCPGPDHLAQQQQRQDDLEGLRGDQGDRLSVMHVHCI